jgi:hypothetical protein
MMLKMNVLSFLQLTMRLKLEEEGSKSDRNRSLSVYTIIY